MRTTFTLFLIVSALTILAQDKQVEYYENGTKKVEYFGEKDKPNGVVKLYFPTGELNAELNFINGIQDGLSKVYFKSGSIEKEMHFKNGQQIDTMKIFYEKGQLHELSIIKNGKKNGIYKLYYENGQIELDGFTKDNMVHGYCVHYKENGDEWKKGEYDMGIPVGNWTEHDSIGVTFKQYGKPNK